MALHATQSTSVLRVKHSFQSTGTDSHRHRSRCGADWLRHFRCSRTQRSTCHPNHLRPVYTTARSSCRSMNTNHMHHTRFQQMRCTIVHTPHPSEMPTPTIIDFNKSLGEETEVEESRCGGAWWCAYIGERSGLYILFRRVSAAHIGRGLPTIRRFFRPPTTPHQAGGLLYPWVGGLLIIISWGGGPNTHNFARNMQNND